MCEPSELTKEILMCPYMLIGDLLGLRESNIIFIYDTWLAENTHFIMKTHQAHFCYYC